MDVVYCTSKYHQHLFTQFSLESDKEIIELFPKVSVRNNQDANSSTTMKSFISQPIISNSMDGIPLIHI